MLIRFQAIYGVTVSKSETQDDLFIGACPELSIVTQGTTWGQARDSIADALLLLVRNFVHDSDARFCFNMKISPGRCEDGGYFWAGHVEISFG